MSKEAKNLEMDQGQPESGRKSTKKDLDISKYLKPEAAKRFAEAQVQKASKASENELDTLIAQSKVPGLREAVLNKELIDGYEQIYANQTKYTDYVLRRIMANASSKPWEVAAAKNVLHARMKQENPVRGPHSKPKAQHVDFEDEVVTPEEETVDNRVAMRDKKEEEEEAS